MKPTRAQLAAAHGGKMPSRHTAPRGRMAEHVLTAPQAEEPWFVLQLPLHLVGPNARVPRWLKGQNKQPGEQRAMLWQCLTTQLRGVNEHVAGIVFERLTTDVKGLDRKDNLRMAFKALADGLCAWIVEGARVREPRVLKRIGTYDDLVFETWRMPCEYKQRVKHESHGVRITLHLGELPLRTRAQ